MEIRIYDYRSNWMDTTLILMRSLDTDFFKRRKCQSNVFTFSKLFVVTSLKRLVFLQRIFIIIRIIVIVIITIGSPLPFIFFEMTQQV